MTNTTRIVLYAALTVLVMAGFKTPIFAAEKTAVAIDRSRMALLIMDYQNDIVNILPEKDRAPLLEKASTVLNVARRAGLPVIYVVVRFRDGYPEISSQNRMFSGLKKTGWLREGTPGTEIHQQVAPQPGDIVVTKRRVGAFSTTDLETILRAKNIDTLAMFGIATSGVVLSTVRWAADMDYQLVVISDACADRSDDVHRVLTQKVFPMQATVVTAAEFVESIGAKESGHIGK